MDEKEMLEAIKNCFSGFTQGGSCCGPSATSFGCCGNPKAPEEDKNSEEKN